MGRKHSVIKIRTGGGLGNVAHRMRGLSISGPRVCCRHTAGGWKGHGPRWGGGFAGGVQRVCPCRGLGAVPQGGEWVSLSGGSLSFYILYWRFWGALAGMCEGWGASRQDRSRATRCVPAPGAGAPKVGLARTYRAGLGHGGRGGAEGGAGRVALERAPRSLPGGRAGERSGEGLGGAGRLCG